MGKILSIKTDNQKLYRLAFEELQKEMKNETQPERALSNFLVDFIVSFKRKERERLIDFIEVVYMNIIDLEEDDNKTLKLEPTNIKTYTFEYKNKKK